jgi:beta-glucosidase
VTVPRDDRWGRTYEGYSENPDLVARYATAMVEGLQGKPGSTDFLDGTHVIASSKHFIGDGGTTGGKDKGNTEVPEAQLRDIHGAGHIAAVRAGTQTVMASFSSWNGVKMHGNQSLLTDVLKGRLGFDGFVVGDWDGHAQVPGCTKDDCAAALIAGVDMFMAPESWRAIYTNTIAEVRAGTIPMQRLDDAVTRILRVKFRLGLFDAGLPSRRALGGKFEQLGSDEHRQLARTAVRESLVLLKNNQGLLPLDPKRRVLVAGDGADNVGKQAGGWTLSWQGTGNKPADFPRADSIWAGIRAATATAGGVAELSIDGDYTQRPDVAIVVFGEDPYAEFLGDIPNLAFQPGKASNLALLRKLKAEGIPVVSVFLSGRPLWVNREINASDAFVAAWLPGSEGGGVADVLFTSADGKVAHDFKGRLSFSWPKSAVQSPLNFGQPDYDPQFPLGYGLSYRAPSELAVLSEVSGLADDGAVPGLFFGAGKTASGWSWSIMNIDVSPTDHLAQEDARQLHWRTGAQAHVGLHSDTALDLSRETQSGLLLVATLRLDAQPSTSVSVGLRCGAACAGQVSLQAVLPSLTVGQWTRVGIPLACFAHAGADLSRVTDLFELDGSAPLDVSVSQVALSAQADHTVSCIDNAVN